MAAGESVGEGTAVPDGLEVTVSAGVGVAVGDGVGRGGSGIGT
ncbi:hypothetical protein ACVWYS_000886 [Arthrobacter sp. TE12231]